MVGRDRRFLQGHESDPAAVGRLREAIAAGSEAREVVADDRGPARPAWWNEVVLSPVRDAQGALVRFVGCRPTSASGWRRSGPCALERDRTGSLAGRVETLARTDRLTGLLNRWAMTEALEIALWDARARGDHLVVAMCDVDGFRGVDEEHGQAIGAEVPLPPVPLRDTWGIRGQVGRGTTNPPGIAGSWART